jgi:hypothetical protein
MRRILIGLTLLIVLAVITTGTLVFLAERHPFRPGQPLFPIQQMAESLQLRLTFDAADKADLALDLARRRLDDLATAGTDKQLLAAAPVLKSTLEIAVLRVSAAPVAELPRLIERLNELLGQAGPLVAGLAAAYPELADLLATVTAIGQAANPNQLAAIVDAPALPMAIAGEPVPFVGTDIDHSFFPLDGGHAAALCQDCHATGQYSETPTECVACHLSPPDHYEGDCATCHVIGDWLLVAFDHTGLTDCQDCHLEDRPPDHYEGQCSGCHTTSDWLAITFDHTGLTDCQSCHEEDRPEFHYPGQCSTCHLPSDWEQVSFNHAGFNDCQSCHTREAPVNHYPWPVLALPQHGQLAARDLQPCRIQRLPGLSRPAGQPLPRPMLGLP